MFVKPSPGMHVRDPVTKRPLPAEGREVPDSSFWLRRLAAGDVVAHVASAPEPVVNQIPDSVSTTDKGEE